MNCWVICLICVVAFLAIMGILIGIVLGVVFNLLKTLFTVEQFTTEMLVSYNGHETVMRLVSFNRTHFYQEIAFNGSIDYSYVYGTDDTKTGSCSRVGDHHNCYVTSGGATGAFSMYNYYGKEKNVECPTLSAPTLGGQPRNLTSCDLYTTTNEEVWVESGTNYPVKVHLRSVDLDTGAVTELVQEFTSFDPALPTDTTKLAPLAGVKVYDFREGKSGLYDTTTKSSASAAAAAAAGSSKRGTSVPPQQVAEVLRARFGRVAAALYSRAKGLPQDRLARARALRERLRVFDVPTAGPSVGAAPVPRVGARDEIPASFDVRTAWPACAAVTGRVSDQGHCGSCWAMSSAAVVSDRVCIASGGRVQVHYSPQYMINCYMRQLGCNGGRPDPVWLDIKEEGLVPEECVPFIMQDEACGSTCSNRSAYPARRHTKNAYSPWGATDAERVAAIQRDIMQHGSVSASYLVFNDFPKFAGAVYQRGSKARLSGLHMVRIVGWGTTSDGVPYWTVANSWGEDWGDNGFFRIRRGNNECNIEEVVMAGEPLMD